MRSSVGRGAPAAITVVSRPPAAGRRTAISSGAPGAITVLAASERGGLLHAPDCYMEKIVVGPSCKDAVELDAPVAENLRNIAKRLNRKVEDLAVVVLDRPRHAELIREIRETIRRLGETKTILLSTHILQEVEAVVEGFEPVRLQRAGKGGYAGAGAAGGDFYQQDFLTLPPVRQWTARFTFTF